MAEEKVIIEYKTVQDSDSKKFDDRINKYISLGWELYGSPYILFFGSKPAYHNQAMVKRGSKPSLRLPDFDEEE
jgi:hypothetical protein